MKTEYKRDMQHNYLVIYDQKQDRPSDSTFQEKMLVYNKLEGLLPFHVQQLNGEQMIYYEINGYQPLSEICAKIPPKVDQLSMLVKGLLTALRQAPEYLLKEDDFLIMADQIFIGLPNYDVHICYYSGYQHLIKVQLAEFFESFMGCVDYEDREAVYLVYSLYMKSKETNCTIDDLMKLVDNQGSPMITKNSDFNYYENRTQEPKKEQITPSILSAHEPCIRTSNRSNESILLQEQVKDTVTKQPYSMFPPAMDATYNPPNQRVVEHACNYKKTTSVRPLISQSRQEEQEVFYYPSKYYLFGGIIVLVVTLICGVIASSGLLKDSVTHKLEPIKFAALLVIILVPTIYALIKIFDPKNKVSKIISIGLYEPSIHQEMAAAMELDHKTYSKRVEINEEVYDKNDINKNDINKKPEVMPQRDNSKPFIQNQSLFVNQSSTETESNCTKLLNGVTSSPFPQLLSEKPDIADSITIMDCPFYIGTVKNRMNYSLTSPVISRYHAKIELIEEAYYLIDLNSTNGTFLNGKRVTAEEPNVLVPGDKIAFANICFIFTCPNR